MVVASFGNDVEEIVIGVDDRISLIDHVHRVGLAIIPVVKDNIGVYLNVSLHLCLGTPHSDGLPFASQVSVIVVNKAEVFVGIARRVLIRAYINLLAIKPWKKLVPDSIHEGVGVRVTQVKKLFRVGLAGQVWTVLREGQGMCRRINFWCYRDGICTGN